MSKRRYLFCSDNFDHFINLSEELEQENKRLKNDIQKLIDRRPEVWLKNALNYIINPDQRYNKYPYTTKEGHGKQ